MKVLIAIAFVILSSLMSGQRLIPVLTDYSVLMDGEGSTGVYFDAIEYDGRLFFGGKPSSIEDQTFNGGVVVRRGKLSNGTVTIDLSDIPSGIYHVVIGYQSKTLIVS